VEAAGAAAGAVDDVPAEQDSDAGEAEYGGPGTTSPNKRVHLTKEQRDAAFAALSKSEQDVLLAKRVHRKELAAALKTKKAEDKRKAAKKDAKKKDAYRKKKEAEKEHARAHKRGRQISDSPDSSDTEEPPMKAKKSTAETIVRLEQELKDAKDALNPR
jgi:hypothetical protein